MADTATVEVTAGNTGKYQVRQKLPKTAMIELGEGENINLKASGDTVEYSIQGPYSGKHAKRKGWCGFIEMVFDLAGPRTRRFSLPPNPDYLDLSTADDFDFCYSAAAPVTLWRNDAPDSGKLVIKKEGGKKPAAQYWPALSNTLAWPQKTPIINGARYLVELDGVPVEITLHQLPPEEPPSNLCKASRMAEKGCFHQAGAALLSAGAH
ncbi:MAG: hypothetical protein GY862_27565 [Gammaproteobacteria bacterium]|nr:hypothetical protein [Gammaproteobacteria bacterium]